MNTSQGRSDSDSPDGKWRFGNLPTIGEIRRWTYPKVNEYFTVACFATPPIGGSVVSFVYNGGALWCLLEVLRGRYKLPREPHYYAMTAALYAYSLAMILSALLNARLGASVLQLTGVLSLLLFPFSYAIWRVSDKEAIMRACLGACAIACFGGLIIAVTQVHLFSVNRATGGAANPLVFSNVIALSGGAALIGVFKHVGRRRFFFLAAYFASALAVVYSASRGPLIVVVANAIIVPAVYARGRGLRMVLLAAAAVILLLTLILASGVSPLSHRLEVMLADWSAIAEHGNFSSSVGIRVALWQIGLDLWLEKPLVGWGAGIMPDLIKQHLTAQYGITRGFSHFHNVFLNTMVEGGLLALSALLAMVAVPITVALRVLSYPAREVERFGATLLLLILTMFLITGMTNLVLRHDIMDAVFMIFLVVGLYLAAGTPAPSIADIREPEPREAAAGT